ncbi:hypothetical protein [Gemmata sp.]|uniref:hypothetical protein n=1 Tax=Gemmata sp. TaxID=1914242 RepID=UPI003F71BFBD
MSFLSIVRADLDVLLKRLDDRFVPRVSAICVPRDGATEQRIGVCSEHDALHPESFRGVQDRVKDLIANDPESASYLAPDPEAGWTPSHQQLLDTKVRRIRSRALVRAVTEAANNAAESTGFATIASWPFDYQDNNGVFVVQVQQEVYSQYHPLSKDSYTGAFGRREYRRERSLVDAVVWQYLLDAVQLFSSNAPISALTAVADHDYVFTRAGRSLAATAAIGTGHSLASQGLYDDLNNLSTLKYEGEEGRGTIVFARPEHPHIRVDASFVAPVPLSSPGAVRKLLQMTSREISALCDGRQVYGLGGIRDDYPLADEDAFTVRFERQFSWGLFHGSHAMMHVRYGVPSVKLPGFPHERFRATTRRVFPSLDPAAADNLAALAAGAASQGHGCMLVICRAAAEEAARLAAQCTRIVPVPMTTELLPRVTSIDGSVLVDTEGVCHAIGVILDGLASLRCSPDRGARYNSAVRYVYNRREQDVVALVKSEDGMVSIFPE